MNAIRRHNNWRAFTQAGSYKCSDRFRCDRIICGSRLEHAVSTIADSDGVVVTSPRFPALAGDGECGQYCSRRDDFECFHIHRGNTPSENILQAGK